MTAHRKICAENSARYDALRELSGNDLGPAEGIRPDSAIRISNRRNRFQGDDDVGGLVREVVMGFDYSSGLRPGEIGFSLCKPTSFELRGACPVTRLNTREKAAALW